MLGFIGRLARVDLSKGKVREEEIEEEVFRKFLGGRGLAAKILLEELDPNVDPLSPENKLIFATGPLTGTAYPGSGKHIVAAKSPLTSLWGESASGGYWGPELKFAGYDALIVEGRASSPVYLWIHDREVEVRDGSHLWGMTVVEATKKIRRETDEHARVACIGPAGEMLVRYACIINDMNHASGRTGLGAVMGSKNLKAVAVYGSRRRLETAKPNEFKNLLVEAHKILKESSTAQSLFNYGTSGGVPSLNELGILPTKNFQTGVFEGSERISGQAMAETILVGRTTCMGCPIQCVRAVRVEGGRFGGVTEETGGPQYETVAAFGSLLLNDNLESIAYAHYLCNQYGIDTISTGVAIAFAMECYEKEVLRKEDTGGLELRWGDPETILKLIEIIVRREGLGDVLAEGVKRAAERIGKGAERYAMHVKGQELPMHEPRGKKALALAYAISNRGACHLTSSHDTSFSGKGIPELGIEGGLDRFAVNGKGRFVKRTEDLMGFCNSAVICRFTTAVLNPAENIPIKMIAKFLEAATGWNVGPRDLQIMGERAVNLTRIFNVRLGVTRKDDVIPSRFAEEMPEGASKGQKVTPEDLDLMLDEYYEERGWTRNGIPTKERLEALGIGEFARLIP